LKSDFVFFFGGPLNLCQVAAQGFGDP
jgi:hypothetical protein